MKSIYFTLTVFSIIVISFSHKHHKPKRAIVIGIDGFNPRCLPEGKIPNFMKFVQESSWTYARTASQAVSAPGWSNILCSLQDVDTGIVDNDYVPRWVNGTSRVNVTPVSGNKSLPCVFEQVKKQNPQMRTTYIYDWDWLMNFNSTNIGYIDNDIFCNTTTAEDYIRCDNTYINNILDEIKTKTLGFAFFYIGELDEIGHDKGFCSDIYKEYITKVDAFVGRIVDELEASGLDKETVVLITSDHGATPGTKDHGDFNDENLFVWWMVKGPNVRKNYRIKSNVHNIDTMPTVLDLLDMKRWSNQWRGKAIKEIKDEKENGFLEDNWE